MSGNTKEWIVVISAIGGLVFAAVAEVLWLARAKWTGTGSSIAFVLISNAIAIVLGGLVSFAVFGTMLAMAWSGALSDIPGGNWTLALLLAFCFTFPPVLLMLVKRVLLGLMKIRTGRQAWLFAFVAAIGTFAVSILPAVSLAYLI